jgi:K+-sensing histidine kinase KdpD
MYLTRAKGGGTGLGLANVRDLARAQDGKLVVENIKGKGETLRLSCPAMRPVGCQCSTTLSLSTAGTRADAGL